MAKIKVTKVKVAPAPARVAAFHNGVDAETRAADYLAARGYEIAARRFKTRFGEIDLIARLGSLVAFIEVKARAKLDDAAYAVTLRQQKRIINAAQIWLASHPNCAASDLRFDALLIAPNAQPRHLIAAFDASE